jgi:hypothetical protein
MYPCQDSIFFRRFNRKNEQKGKTIHLFKNSELNLQTISLTSYLNLYRGCHVLVLFNFKIQVFPLVIEKKSGRLNLLDKSFIFLFLAFENPNKQVRDGFYAKQTSDFSRESAFSDFSGCFESLLIFYSLFFFGINFLRLLSILRSNFCTRKKSPDFESTLTTDCASLRHLARKTHRCSNHS